MPIAITSLVITLMYFMVMSHFGYKEVALTSKACENSLTLGNAKLIVLDSVLYQGIQHELASFRSSLHDKIDILVLYEKSKRRGNCIPTGESLSLEAVHYQSKVRWPVRINIQDYKIVVEYTKNRKKSKPLKRISISWE